MCGSNGRRGGGMTIGLKEGAVGTDGLRLPPKIPLRKTARWLTYFWADCAPQESRRAPTGKKGGGAKLANRRRSRSHFLPGCCPSVLNEDSLAAPWGRCGRGGEPPLTSVPLCGQLPPRTHTHSHSHFLLNAAAGTF